MPEYKPRGRPKSNKPPRVRFHITLAPELAAKMEALSRAQGRSMSEIVSDARDRWVAAKIAAPRKPYTRPEVTIGPRDEEDIIEALCALNPYM